MMQIDRNNLPNDVEALKAIVIHLLDVVEEQQRIIEEQRQQIERLTQQIQALQRHRYGRRSERTGAPSTATSPPKDKTKGQRSAHGRQRLPTHLSRERRDYELSEEERTCPSCGGLMERIGALTCEQLDIVPVQLQVIEHARIKYACRHCQENVKIAPMPPQPIEKGLPSPRLSAHVLVAKYADHMPLYRQTQRFKRYGISLSRSTLNDWVLSHGQLLAPLVERMVQKALIPCGHLFGDDTPIRVLERQEGQGKNGRFWIYTSKGNNHYPACTVYDYTSTRQAKGPITFLKDFRGYFQADAFSGYDTLYQNNEAQVIEIACWAHARRRFYESALGTPKDSFAHKGLAFIQSLYKIEADIRSQQLTPAQTKAWRHKYAKPVLQRFHVWLKKHFQCVLPKSPLGEAIAYTLNHWQALNNYLLDGCLEIDNNRSERGLRPLAVGRKNYLFVGNDTGGQVAAVIYSLIETCKQHNINPEFYIADVLDRISTHPNSRIDELLPYNWKPLQNNAASSNPIQIAA